MIAGVEAEEGLLCDEAEKYLASHGISNWHQLAHKRNNWRNLINSAKTTYVAANAHRQTRRIQFNLILLPT